MKHGVTIFTFGIRVFFVIAVITLLSGGAWLYLDQEKIIRKRIEDDLGTITRLKAEQISEWRKDQLIDAEFLQQHPFFLENAHRFIEEKSEDARRELLIRFRNQANQHDHADVVLVAPDGTPLLSLEKSLDAHTAYLPALAEALGNRSPAFTELHMESPDTSPHISVVVPLYMANEPGTDLFAALILRNDASQFLYPLIQFWPTSSDTAETLLVRKDGDDVLFLNDLRHQPNTALALHIPLSRTDVPAVMAVMGRQGVFHGKDYRGVDVVSVIQPIQNSPWFMITKIDTAEAFADWRFRSILMLGLLVGLMVCIVTTAMVFWQRDKKAQYRALYYSEAALRANTKRHSITLMAIGDAVISTDARGVVELINPSAEALTGWKQKEARGRPLSDVFHIINEMTRELSEDPVAKVLREGIIVGLANHTILVSRDGTEWPIADSGAPIRNDVGDIIGVVLVFRDQSAERAAQETIRKSEERYRQVLDGMLEGCQIIDPDWKYVYLNEAAVRQSLKDRDELLGRTMMEVYPGIEDTHLFAVLQSVMADRQPRSMENEFRYPDDARGYFELSIEPVPEGLFILSIDITERKDAELELQRSMERQQFLANIIETAQQPLAVGYPDGRLGIFNRAFCDLTGYDREELKEINWNETLTPPEWRQIETVALAEAARNGSPARYEKEYLRKDGTRVPIELLVHTQKNEASEIQYYYAFVSDITLRKRTEKEHERLHAQLIQAQKMEAVGRLAGGVAHDYNNILSVIIGYSELALEKVNSDDPLAEDLTEILTAAHRSKDITRQLLAFARKETIAPEVLDLNETVENMLKILRKLIGEDIDLVWNPGKVHQSVLMDPSQLDQILANLCVNARDAISDVGRITIRTDFVTFDDAYCADHADSVPGEFVRLEVSDDGSGMDRKTMDNIFEPFFTTKVVGKGTGLGLSTVYGIVRQNNGFINVYSEPGLGTAFRIYLPAHSGDVSAKQTIIDEVVPNGNGETLLVVEDEMSILKLAERILSNCNYKVLLAKSPAEAFEVAREHADEISLLITDVVMPEMNGRELADQLKALYPGIKCLFMSGYTANVIAHRGVLDEGIQFIQKPFSTKGLAAKVRDALSGLVASG